MPGSTSSTSSSSLSTTTDAFDTRADLGWLAGHLLRRAQQRHVAAWAGAGPRELTSPQFAVLHALHHRPDIDQVALGEAAAIDRSTVAELVARLVQRGLLSRRRDPADGRRHMLALTDQGEAAWRSAQRSVLAVHDELLAPLSDAEQARLLRLLTKLACSPSWPDPSWPAHGAGHGSH